jgi:hypothetical protein
MSEPPEIKGKRVTVRPTGNREDLTWEMCSKLIHPSSWGINHFDETVNNPGNRQFLAIQVLWYGWGIVNIFHDIDWTT